ncbi:MAG: FixH family protein, partial [Pseudomonadota bacterium]
EVKNSYVASQHFDAERDAQLALAWQIDVTVEGEALVLAINDANGPVTPKITRATLGRPTHVYDDQELVFTFDGQTHWAKILPLGRGNWNLRLAATAADGTEFKQRIVLWVPR